MQKKCEEDELILYIYKRDSHLVVKWKMKCTCWREKRKIKVLFFCAHTHIYVGDRRLGHTVTYQPVRQSKVWDV